MTAIDLFAGCGGLSLGLKWAGWNIACAVERSPIAAETYFANFIHAVDQGELKAAYASHLQKAVNEQIEAGLLVDDIQRFKNNIASFEEVWGGQEIALLAGGPPCQGFSVAGRRDACDPRNQLVWSFLAVAESLHPLLVMMENVCGMQSPFEKGGGPSVLPDLELALQQTGMTHGGYSTVRLVLTADQYGVPQRRKRVFPRWCTQGSCG